jgi:integrase
MTRARKTARREGYYDERRGLYIAEIDLGKNANGGRKRKRVTARDYDVFERKLREARHKLDHGLPLVDEAQTVRAWCEHYIAEILPYGNAAKSAKDRAEQLHNYVLPYLGSKRLATLTPADVRRWLRTLEARDSKYKRDGEVVKLSPATVGKARFALSAALSAAMRDEVVARNVVTLTDPPRGSSGRRVDPLTVDEANAVLATSAAGRVHGLTGEAIPDRLEALAVLVLALGLRQAEALDLRWSTGLDLEAGTLSVVDAKTAAGVRTIPLPAFVVAALEAHRARQRVERLAAPVWADADLVFPTRVGTRIGSRNCLRWWHDLTTRAGIGRRRFHAARHTAATVMLNYGVPLEQISSILGHASLTITSDIYAKPGAELLRGAAAVIDAAYANGGSR